MSADFIARAAGSALHAAGAAPAAAPRAITLRDVAVLDRVLAGASDHDKVAIGRRLLDEPAVNSTPALRGPLASIHAGLDSAGADDVRASIVVAKVRDMIATEVGRIDGTVPTTGLAGHPAYEKVGGIRSMLGMLETMGALP